MDLWSVRLERRFWRGDRREDLIFYVDQLDGPSGQSWTRGRDRGYDIPYKTGLLTLGHKERPVGVDQTLKPLPRHILRRRYCKNTVYIECAGRVYGDDPGAGVGREEESAVEHIRHFHIIYVWPCAKDGFAPFIAGQTRADPTADLFF